MRGKDPEERMILNDFWVFRKDQESGKLDWAFIGQIDPGRLYVHHVEVRLLSQAVAPLSICCF